MAPSISSRVYAQAGDFCESAPDSYAGVPAGQPCSDRWGHWHPRLFDVSGQAAWDSGFGPAQRRHESFSWSSVRPLVNGSNRVDNFAGRGGGNQRRVVIEDEFVPFELESLTKKRQIVLKQGKASCHGRTSWHEDFRCWAVSLQPVSYHFDGRLWQVVMRANILPGNIGTKLLIAIAGTIKDEASF